MCSSPYRCGVPACSLKDCRLVSNPVVLATSSFIHQYSSKIEVFIGNTVTRTYKDIFTQRCACIWLVFFINSQGQLDEDGVLFAFLWLKCQIFTSLSQIVDFCTYFVLSFVHILYLLLYISSLFDDYSVILIILYSPYFSTKHDYNMTWFA